MTCDVTIIVQPKGNRNGLRTSQINKIGYLMFMTMTLNVKMLANEENSPL